MANKKIKEFFLKDVFGAAGFEANEIEFLSSASDITDIEITDELVEKYHNNMLSREAAMNDSDISKKYRTNLWGEFTTLMDTRIKKILPHLTEEQQITIKEIKGTPDKLDKVVEYLNIKKPAKDDSEVQKELETLKGKYSKQQTDYESQISGLKETHTGEITDKDKKFKNFQIDNLIRGEINDYNLIDNIPGGKNYLAGSVIADIKKDPKFVINLNDSSSGVDLYQRSDSELKYMVDGKEAILKQVLEPRLKEWIKNSPGPPPGKPKPIPEPGKPLTFAEMNVALAKEKLVEAAADLQE